MERITIVSKMRVDEFKDFFKNNPFTSDEFYDFYLQKEPDLKKTTFRGRVHNLKKNGIIYSPRRGLYVIENRKEFNPVIDKKLHRLYKKVKTQFPYSDMCIWETNWLNSYMVHQPISNDIIIEIEQEAASAALAFLQESLKNIYLNPGKHEIENYMHSGQSNIIIKNLVIESPVEATSGVVIPKIEKIIVDLFAEDELFVTYQGGELKNIYEELFNKYNINQSTINRYATRRSVADRLIIFLKKGTDINNDKIYI